MNALMKLVVAFHVRLFRWSKGRMGASMGASKMLLLTTTGKKTGKARTVPVVYIEDAAGNPVVTASAAGRPTHPAWYTNLVANPDVTVELPGNTYRAHAAVANPEERAKLWAQLTATNPGFLGYQKKTTREIPMVILQPASR